MTTGVSCTVLVDGVPAADGAPGDAAADPVILDDLAVTWGRADTMSQPEPDACTFQVMDPAGGQAFMAQYRTGARLDVLARGDTYPDPSTPTFTDPGFETGAVTWSATGGTATRSSARPHTGGFALGLLPAVAGVPATVLLAPGVFQAPGTNPDAWDAIPTTSSGQTWASTVDVWVPPGASVSVRAALFTGPYAAAGTPAGVPETVQGTGAWVTVAAQYVVQVGGQWVGLALELNPTGPTWAQLPPALTWATVDPTWSWADTGQVWIDQAEVTSPAGGTGRGVLVFSGRITDLTAAWDESLGCPVIAVTATGFTADLQNRNVGEGAWSVEAVTARAHRILTLAGLPVTIDIDPSIAGQLLSWRDVDSQGATGLLQEIATSVDGVLWPAVHVSLGAYLRLEDPSLRASLLVLVLEGGIVTIVQADPDVGFDLSACVILRDPVQWVQDVSDVVTRAAVGWKVQGVDDKGNPTTTDATVTAVDPDLEALYGTRRVAVSTQLQAADDATDVARRILARTSPTGWRAAGLSIDDDDVTGGDEGVALVLDLLDGTSRIGAPLVLGDLPAWSPGGADAGVYLEGGTYRFMGGRWVLELVVSAAAGVGASATWAELDPTWTWAQFDPAITWNDLRGVAA